MKISSLSISADFIANHIMKDRFLPKYEICKYIISKRIMRSFHSFYIINNRAYLSMNLLSKLENRFFISYSISISLAYYSIIIEFFSIYNHRNYTDIILLYTFNIIKILYTTNSRISFASKIHLSLIDRNFIFRILLFHILQKKIEKLSSTFRIYNYHFVKIESNLSLLYKYKSK